MAVTDDDIRGRYIGGYNLAAKGVVRLRELERTKGLTGDQKKRLRDLTALAHGPRGPVKCPDFYYEGRAAKKVGGPFESNPPMLILGNPDMKKPRGRKGVIKKYDSVKVVRGPGKGKRGTVLFIEEPSGMSAEVALEGERGYVRVLEMRDLEKIEENSDMKNPYTKTGLYHPKKGSEEVRERMAYLRSLRGKGKKKNPLTEKEFADVQNWSERRSAMMRRHQGAVGRMSLETPKFSKKQEKWLGQYADQLSEARRHQGASEALLDASWEYGPYDPDKPGLTPYGKNPIPYPHATELYAAAAMANRGENPPAYFVIDPETNKILSVHRGHPMKSHPVAYERATKEAKRLGRSVILVVHPYVPPGFKKGTTVTPLFYHYGSLEVGAEGAYRKNQGIPYPHATELFATAAMANPKMTPKGQAFMSKHIRKHRKKGMKRGQAIRVAYEEARRKGYKAPKPPKKKKGKRSANPVGLPAYISNDPAFKKELAAYRKRHGTGPVQITKVNVPKGFPRYLSAWGKTPEVKYDAPKRSNKGKRIHKFGEGKGKGKKPWLVSSASRGKKFLAFVGGNFRADGEWILQ